MSTFFNDTNRFAPAETILEKRVDGSFVMTSPMSLESHVQSIGEWLDHWAEKRPHATYLAERQGGAWRELTYSDVRAKVGCLAEGLLGLGLRSGAPLVVLSENDLDHALLILAAQYVGIPVASVSVAYSKNEQAVAKLQAILASLEPGAVFINDPKNYQVLAEQVQFEAPVLTSKNSELISGSLPLSDLYKKEESEVVKKAHDQVTPETHARYLLTSGSTGTPKVVVNTHKMLCANQQSIRQCWRFLDQEEIIVLDWLPWSHTFGANHNFNLVLSNGGRLYIDDGRPMPGLIDRTIENLKSVKPTLYFNVPRGYEALLSYLRADSGLREALFGRSKMLFYAAAALPQYCWDELIELAKTVRTEPLFFASEWGATETSPVLTSVHFETDKPGNLGLPVPGVSIKFVPSGDKLEMRVKGPSVFSEYLNAPDLTVNAFDEEGFYKIGDAGYLVDEAVPERGIRFNGRVAEDFKLTTGTWVSVGTMRPALVSALSPYALDCVIAGHDHDFVGALVFITDALRELAGPEGKGMSSEELSQNTSVRGAVLNALAAFAKERPASSQHPAKVLLLNDAPSMEKGELTDKGYLNQRNALKNRAEDVEKLFSQRLSQSVICLTELEEVCEP